MINSLKYLVFTVLILICAVFLANYVYDGRVENTCIYELVQETKCLFKTDAETSCRSEKSLTFVDGWNGTDLKKEKQYATKSNVFIRRCKRNNGQNRTECCNKWIVRDGCCSSEEKRAAQILLTKRFLKRQNKKEELTT